MSDKKTLADFYEKIYFHEIDAREKLYARLSTPLAVLISIAGVLGFMVQNLYRDQSGLAAYIFFVAFSLASVCTFAAGYYLLGGASGDEYSFISASKEWDAYRVKCEALYADFEDKNELVDNAVKQSIIKEYIRCASINAKVNDERSNSLFRAIKYLIISGGLVLLTFLCFFFGGLDKASHSKPTEVVVVKPIEWKGFAMATDKPVPPPPPPPPPARVVREDKRPHSPSPEKKNGN